tara:strand:- start:3278 stop:3973 length:696 start_codon:yes stop_codon:yes gene_type:complete
MKLSKNKINSMFDSISNEYDFLNNIITFGGHVKWKNDIVKIARENNPKTILDIATGTADIAIKFSEIENSKIIGIDISTKMLDVGREKIQNKDLAKRVVLKKGDAENLEFDNSSFDIISIGYGVRNFENLEKGLKESFRVLSPNGKLIILETSIPSNPLIRVIFNIYTKVFISLISSIFSQNPKAYTYLEKSAKNFPSGDDFAKILLKSGFKNVKIEPKLFGASTIYIATK